MQAGQRVLVDASTLIALAATGHLHLLEGLFGKVCTTRVVKTEVLAGEHPDTAMLEEAFEQGRIETVRVGKGKNTQKWERFGLGPGEASLFSIATEGDLLVLDDRNARRFAQARGHRITGLLSLLVHAAEAGVATPGQMEGLLRRLARTDFRMNVELYDWVMARLSQIRD